MGGGYGGPRLLLKEAAVAEFIMKGDRVSWTMVVVGNPEVGGEVEEKLPFLL